MDLYQYLPFYPDFDNELNQILNIPDDNPEKISQSIYWKKEFYDNKLDQIEEKGTRPGQLLKHQQFISRFLSSETPYNELLLMHEPGTGKTCSSVGAIENIKRENKGYKGALILMKGENLIRNYKNELLHVCTNGKYLPKIDDDDKLLSKKLRRLRRAKKINKNLSTFYDFRTFQTFSNEIADMDDNKIRQKYSNLIIVIDEAHNLRRREDANQYANIHRFLHTITNCKILLLTGTPMRDQAFEIVDMMNLLLPMGKQIVTDNFDRLYLDKDSGKVKPEKINEIKSWLRGRVSYLRAMKSNAIKEFYHNLSLKYFKLYRVNMENPQTQAYEKAYRSDTEEKSSFFSQSRQASLFVFPDGSYGKEGSKKYITKTKIMGVFRYSLRPSFVSAIKDGIDIQNDTKEQKDERMLQNIRKYGCKYAECIENIRKGNGECHFVYNEFVSGSGSILFSQLLSLFGIKHALLIGTLDSSYINSIIRQFNSDDNRDGSKIQVVIGSSVLSEGFTLKNVQHVHILTPSWNFSETDQVIARAYRLFSHRALFELSGMQRVAVRIYLYCAIYNGHLDDQSIDYKMFKTCEDKDVSIKSMERLIKEVSVDCALNYERNKSRNPDDEKDTRDCEYQDCDYVCDYNPNPDEEKYAEIDNDTYYLHVNDYNDPFNQAIIRSLKKIFQERYQLSYPEIFRDIFLQHPNITEYHLMNIINHLIKTNEIVKDAMGFNCVMRNDLNKVYITYNLKHSYDFFESYYVEHFPLQQYRRQGAMFNKEIERLRILLHELKTETNQNKKQKILESFPIDARQMLLELCVLSDRDVKKEVIGQENNSLRETVIEFYNKYIKQLDDGTIISTFTKENRCLPFYPSPTPKPEDAWVKCTQQQIDKLSDLKTKTIQDIPDNEYGWAGLKSKNEKFLLINTKDLQKQKEFTALKKTQVQRGQACESHNLATLVSIIDRVKISPKTEEIGHLLSKDRETLLSDIIDTKKPKYKHINEAFNSKDELLLKSKDDLIRMMFWVDQGKKEICEVIEKFLEEKGLIYDEKMKK